MNLGEIRVNALNKTDEVRKNEVKKCKTQIELLKYELKKREAVIK